MSKINRSIFVAISLTTTLIACFILTPVVYTTLPGIVILALGGTTAILSWIDIFKISVQDGMILSILFLVSSIGNIICAILTTICSIAEGDSAMASQVSQVMSNLILALVCWNVHRNLTPNNKKEGD